MDSSHKRLLRATKLEYSAAEARLKKLAKQDYRELWYDEKKEMIGFRGKSLQDLAVFAEKCSKILQSVQAKRLSKSDLNKKKADEKLAAKKIKQARSFVYEDKVSLRKSAQKRKVVLSQMEAEIVGPQLDDVAKIYQCDFEWNGMLTAISISGTVPYPDNMARHIQHILERGEEERELSVRMKVQEKAGKGEEDGRDEEVLVAGVRKLCFGE